MSPRNETVRVFVAVSISDEARAQLVEAVARIRREVPDGVQWANPDGMHLTLKFLGNIPAPTLHPLYECLAPVVDGHSPFPLELAGLGVFPNSRRPRVLWAAVTGDMNALSLLQLATEGCHHRLRPPAGASPFLSSHHAGASPPWRFRHPSGPYRRCGFQSRSPDFLYAGRWKEWT